MIVNLHNNSTTSNSALNFCYWLAKQFMTDYGIPHNYSTWVGLSYIESNRALFKEWLLLRHRVSTIPFGIEMHGDLISFGYDFCEDENLTILTLAYDRTKDE